MDAFSAESNTKLDPCSHNNNRIQKFSPNGIFLVAFGTEGKGPGQFDRLTDIAADRVGNLFVVDFGIDRIEEFGPKSSR